MTGFGHGLRVIGRQMHLLHQREGPSEVLKGKIAELEKFRKMKRSTKKDQFTVDVPESNSFLDTPSMPMILTAVGIALFAKLLMMVCAIPQLGSVSCISVNICRHLSENRLSLFFFFIIGDSPT